MTAVPGSAALALPARVLCLAGPTAVGKSEIALLLTERLNAEIISVDSMQVYRGLDIGTAKPAPADRARVPHHLVDVLDLKEPFSVADFVRLARESAERIHARGRLVLLCGGTGLYFKALLHGLGNAPPSDPVLRAQLEATPLPELLSELARTDPLTYERIDRNNPRRVLRAIEVIRLTGRPYSAQRAAWTTSTGQGQNASVLLGLTRAPADLRRRIELRVGEMFRRGLVAETEHLLRCGLAENKIAFQALGYRQVAEYLQGVRSLPATVELVKIRTWQFAKRQMTWFRNQLRPHWLRLESEQRPKESAGKLAEIFLSKGQAPERPVQTTPAEL